MKIEKISENQIKFILTQSDLRDRNLKLTELAYGSEKMQELFREMMEQAVVECGFYTEHNTPLMIEAIPIARDSIMILVTKVQPEDELDGKTNIIPNAKDERKFKRINPFENMQSIPKTVRKQTPDRMVTFVFKSLEDVTNASSRIVSSFMGDSELYKEKGSYYLILYKNEPITDKEPLISLLSEYGQRQESTPIFKYYLLEHGELIIKKDAVNTLATL